MNNKTTKYFTYTIVSILAIIFILKFGGPRILRTYVEMGLGGSHRLPIFDTVPTQEINNPILDQDYILGLVEFKVGGMRISIPKDFTLINEHIKKAYYKKKSRPFKGPVIYLLYEKPEFFISLFPDVKKQGITNDYEFISRMMNTRTSDIKNITSAFFIIIKSIFTPDLGDQQDLKIAKFNTFDKKGFIAYNLQEESRYFNCDVFDAKNNYFKIYIKDKDSSLDLDKVLAIVSTVEKIE